MTGTHARHRSRKARTMLAALPLAACVSSAGVTASESTSTGPAADTTTTATSTATTTSAPDTTEGDSSSTGALPGGEGSATGSGTAEGDASSESTTSSDPVEEAIERGIEGAVGLADAGLVMLMLLDVIHRRFGVDELADSASRYDELLASNPDPPIDAVAFRRVFDPSQTLTADELAQIAPGVNEVTIPALFCDALPLAPAYADRLQSDAALGGYELTHVVLALRWIDELSCPPPLDTDVVDSITADTFALIDTRDGLEDLEIEAAIFGTLLAGPDALPPDIVDALLAGQLDDGTWPHDPGGTEGAWHASGLALLLLLELDRRALDDFVAS